MGIEPVLTVGIMVTLKVPATWRGSDFGQSHVRFRQAAQSTAAQPTPATCRQAVAGTWTPPR